MRVEETQYEAAMNAFYACEHGFDASMRAALAAVAPLIRAAALEEAAGVADAFPARSHGALATAPYAAAEQAADEIAAAIRALKEPT